MSNAIETAAPRFIQALRTAAAERSDAEVVTVCDRVLAGNGDARNYRCDMMLVVYLLGHDDYRARVRELTNG